MISAAIHEAGLPGRCKAHGLRKAAARRLAEAGRSVSEIAAITGHKTLAEVERYTRTADQERFARPAIRRQSENRSGKPPAGEVANTTDEALEINNLMAKMALPREVRELRNFKGLPKRLGKWALIDLQCVLQPSPKHGLPNVSTKSADNERGNKNSPFVHHPFGERPSAVQLLHKKHPKAYEGTRCLVRASAGFQ